MRPKRSYCKRGHYMIVERDALHSIKKYVKYSTYRRLLAAYKDKPKVEKSICIPMRVRKREEKNKKFLRLAAKAGRMLYGGCGNDTQTLMNVMDLAFKKGDYTMIGPLAEMLEPDEDDTEAIGLMKRLLYSRSNLTEFNVSEGRKK